MFFHQIFPFDHVCEHAAVCRGGGAAEMFGVASEVDIHIGTLSKGFGSHGGFVAGSSVLKSFLMNKGRSYVFSTALPLPAVAAAQAAISVCQQVGLSCLIMTACSDNPHAQCMYWEWCACWPSETSDAESSLNSAGQATLFLTSLYALLAVASTVLHTYQFVILCVWSHGPVCACLCL